MKIHAARPARAACAATALARLPVDAQPTVSSPNAIAALIAVDDDAVLERERRMRHGVVLHPHARHAELVGEPRRVDQRREAGVERRDRLALERQPLAIAPQRLRPRGDRRAIRQPARSPDTAARADRGSSRRSRRAPRRSRCRTACSAAHTAAAPPTIEAAPQRCSGPRQEGSRSLRQTSVEETVNTTDHSPLTTFSTSAPSDRRRRSTGGCRRRGSTLS